MAEKKYTFCWEVGWYNVSLAGSSFWNHFTGWDFGSVQSCLLAKGILFAYASGLLTLRRATFFSRKLIIKQISGDLGLLFGSWEKENYFEKVVVEYSWNYVKFEHYN